MLYNLFYETHGPEWAGVYLDACESGDLHTFVATLVWPDLPWSSNDAKANRKIAEELFYRQDSRRQVCKKSGHATNYRSIARTLAKKVGLPAQMVQDFQDKYYVAFPCISEWHKHSELQLKEEGWPASLTTLYGRKRVFYDRNTNAEKLRDMAAFGPQSL